MEAKDRRQGPGSARWGPSVPGGLPIASSLALVLLIGVLDYLTGYEFSIALLYFLPVALASLLVGRRSGVTVSVLCALVWFSAEVLARHRYQHSLALYWNTAVRLGIFLTVSLLLSRLQASASRERSQRKKLEELNRLKSRFVGMAAHDLRSPLAVIGIYTDFLLEDGDSGLTEKQVRFLAVIRKKTEHMLNMINDLLDITMIESGRLELHLREQDYGAFLADVVSISGAVADTRGSTFRLEIGEGLPPLRFDRDRMEQALDNLLMNALKFSPPGLAVTIAVAREGDRVVTRVTDRGPGIPAEEQKQLFVEFSKTSVKPARGERSTGLGLAIARKIIESHGGEIGVESAVGEGSTFWFSLPAGGAAKVGG